MIEHASKNGTKYIIKLSALEIIGKEEICIDLLSNINEFSLKYNNNEKNSSGLLSCLTQLTIESAEKAVHYLNFLLDKRSCKFKN